MQIDPKPVLASRYCRCQHLCTSVRAFFVHLRVNPKLFRAIRCGSFKPGSPIWDWRYKIPWLRSLLFWGTIDLDFQGKIYLKKTNFIIPGFSTRVNTSTTRKNAQLHGPDCLTASILCMYLCTWTCLMVPNVSNTTLCMHTDLGSWWYVSFIDDSNLESKSLPIAATFPWLIMWDAIIDELSQYIK